MAALATGHAGRGHYVHVLAVLGRTVEPDAFPLLVELRDAGVPTSSLRIGTRAYGAERTALLRSCAHLRPDLVHTHGYRCDVVDGAAARQAGFPIITTAHGFTAGTLRGRAYEALQRRAHRYFDAVVAVSAPIRERLARAGVPAQRLHLVPNAWPGERPLLARAEARRILGIADERPLIGWVGRLTPEKGADVLLRALHRVRDDAWTAAVIGDGRDAAGLELLARDLDLAGRVRWHGALDDAAMLFRAFDVFVLSSRTEGTPMVLFEAMAAGVPVVATAVGGVPDVVTTDHAVIVPPDSPTDLAMGIRTALAADPATATRVHAARRRLEHYGIGAWLDRYERIYRSITPASGPGEPI